MIAFEMADLVVVASRVLGVDTDTALSMLDVPAASAALTQLAACQQRDDPAHRAAALLHGLLRYRPLARGNDRVALMATVQFLAINGWQLDLDPPASTAAILGDLAGGRVTVVELALWLAPRLHGSAKPRWRRASRTAGGNKGRRTARVATVGRGHMFERFTGAARHIMVLSQEEARMLNHNYIGTEHLLLGLLNYRENATGDGTDGTASAALDSLGVSFAAIRSQVEVIIGTGDSCPSTGAIPFTPRAKKVLELSVSEALSLGSHMVGPEHLLLGLLREGEGVAAQVLRALGADLHQLRRQVIALVQDSPAVSHSLQAEISRVRAAKDAAIDAGDLKTAAGLRDLEKRLLSGEVMAEIQWLRDEVDRLRTLLRRHGIDPDNEASRTA